MACLVYPLKWLFPRIFAPSVQEKIQACDLAILTLENEHRVLDKQLQRIAQDVRNISFDLKKASVTWNRRRQQDHRAKMSYCEIQSLNEMKQNFDTCVAAYNDLRAQKMILMGHRNTFSRMRVHAGTAGLHKRLLPAMAPLVVDSSAEGVSTVEKLMIRLKTQMDKGADAIASMSDVNANDAGHINPDALRAMDGDSLVTWLESIEENPPVSMYTEEQEEKKTHQHYDSANVFVSDTFQAKDSVKMEDEEERTTTTSLPSTFDLLSQQNTLLQ